MTTIKTTTNSKKTADMALASYRACWNRRNYYKSMYTVEELSTLDAACDALRAFAKDAVSTALYHMSAWSMGV